MNDKVSSFSISRRTLLQGLGASVAKIPQANFASIFTADSTITEAMREAFFDNEAYGPLIDWIANLYDQDMFNIDDQELVAILRGNPTDLDANTIYQISWKTVYRKEHSDELVDIIRLYGNSLRTQSPSLGLIQELLHHPVYKTTHSYEAYFEGSNLEQAILELRRMSTMTETELEQFITTKLAERETIMQPLEELARQNPLLSDAIKKMEAYKREESGKNEDRQHSQKYNPPELGFGNMAAARKAAMYPIPDSVSDEEQQQLRIGIHAKPYALSCEHYGTISDRNKQLSDYYASKHAR